MLHLIREQAERSSPALLHIARVEAKVDVAGALHTFDSTIDEMRRLRTSRREWLFGQARPEPKGYVSRRFPNGTQTIIEEANANPPAESGPGGYLEAALARLPEPRSVTITHPRPDTDEEMTGSVNGPGIRCPKCGWRPGPHDRWACKCGHIWNTFDTGGVCPACLYQWTVTACLRCGEWSPHSDWYAED